MIRRWRSPEQDEERDSAADALRRELAETRLLLEGAKGTIGFLFAMGSVGWVCFLVLLAGRVMR